MIFSSKFCFCMFEIYSTRFFFNELAPEYQPITSVCDSHCFAHLQRVHAESQNDDDVFLEVCNASSGVPVNIKQGHHHISWENVDNVHWRAWLEVYDYSSKCYTIYCQDSQFTNVSIMPDFSMMKR